MPKDGKNRRSGRDEARGNDLAGALGGDEDYDWIKYLGKDDPRPRPRRPRSLRRRHLRSLRRRHLRRPWRGQPRGLSRSRNGSAVAVLTGRPGAAVGLRRLARKNSTPDTAPVNLARARPGPDRGRSPVAPSRCGRAARPTCCSIRRLRTTHSRSTRPRTTVSGEPSHRSKIGSGIGSLGTGRRHGGGSGSRPGGWTPPSTPSRYTLVSAPPRLPAPGPRDPGPTTIRSRTPAPAGVLARRRSARGHRCGTPAGSRRAPDGHPRRSTARGRRCRSAPGHAAGPAAGQGQASPQAAEERQAEVRPGSAKGGQGSASGRPGTIRDPPSGAGQGYGRAWIGDHRDAGRDGLCGVQAAGLACCIRTGQPERLCQAARPMPRPTTSATGSLRPPEEPSAMSSLPSTKERQALARRRGRKSSSSSAATSLAALRRTISSAPT